MTAFAGAGRSAAQVDEASIAAVALRLSMNGADISDKLAFLSNLGLAVQCGRLSFVSTTALAFLPYSGDLIKINGLLYRVPTTGIAGLANTNVFVNGVALQNLAAGTLYYVYAFSNAGVVTADFSTTAHALSVAAGNVGVEIKTGDNTRSLIGMVYTNASSQFSAALTNTWFNRVARSGASPLLSFVSPGNYTQELGGGVSIASPGTRVYFLVWGDENAIHASVSSNVSNVSTGVNVNLQVGLDNTPWGTTTVAYLVNNNNNLLAQSIAIPGLGEGLHYVVAMGGTNAGSPSFGGTSASLFYRG